MEYDVSILKLQKTLKGVNYKDVENGRNILAPVFTTHPEKTSTLIYYMALSYDEIKLEQLMNDTKLGSLMNNACIVDQTWFIKTIWDLKLQNFLFEVIEYGPLCISISILPKIIGFFKNESFSLPDNIHKLIMACFNKSNLSNTSNLESHTKELTILMTNTVINTLKLSDKQSSIKSCGLLIVEFLIILENCVNQVYKHKNQDNVKIEFYRLDSEYIENYEYLKNDYNSEPMRKFLLKQLDIILKQISCDVWITWEEIELNTVSLQEIIGNKIFIINENLRSENVSLSHTLEQCFNQFQIKPKTEENEIENSSIEEIINKLRNNSCKTPEKWYNALMIYNDIWNNSILVSFMLSHINLTDTPLEVMEKSLKFIINNPLEVNLNNMFLNVLKTLPLFAQKELFSEICAKKCIDIFCSNDNDENIIITFNKFSTSSDFDELMREIIVLFIQRPLNVILYVFQFAITSKENHDICIYIINHLPNVWKINLNNSDFTNEVPFLSLTLENLLGNSIVEKGVNNLCALLCRLTSENSNVFPVSSLIQNLVAMIDESFSNENLDRCTLLLILLNSISLDAVEDNNKIIFLAFMSQVISRTSWDVESFSKDKVEANELACEVLSKVINTSLADCDWLRIVVNKLDKTAKTQFCSIWLDHNLKFPDEAKIYMKLLLAIRSKSYRIDLEKILININQENLSTLLSFHYLKIIPIIFKNEWLPVFNICVSLLKKLKTPSPFLSTFQILSNSMTMLAISCNVNTYCCFEYCMGSFSNIYNLILPNLPSNDFIPVFNYLLKPLKKITCSIVRDNCFYLVLPILLNSVKNYLDANLKIFDDKSLLPFIVDMDEKWRDDFKTSFNVKILN